MREKISKPSHLVELEGGRQFKKPKKRPRPGFNAPQAPKHLSFAAKKLWRVYVKQLRDAGILTELDGAQLADLCTMETRLLQITRQINENFDLKLVRIERDLAQQVRMMRGDFGMSPLTRTKVEVHTVNAADELEQLLG